MDDGLHHEGRIAVSPGRYNNLSVGVSIKIREGIYRTVENNVIVHPRNPFGPQMAYEDNRDRFVRNIVVASSKAGPSQVSNRPGDVYMAVMPPLKGPFIEEMDHNLLSNDLGAFAAAVIPRTTLTPTRCSLGGWQALDMIGTRSSPTVVRRRREGRLPGAARLMANQGVVTINLAISQEGKVGAASLAQMRALCKAVRGK